MQGGREKMSDRGGDNRIWTVHWAGQPFVGPPHGLEGGLGLWREAKDTGEGILRVGEAPQTTERQGVLIIHSRGTIHGRTRR